MAFYPFQHYIGIAGAGMAPLARIGYERGARISGSDLRAGPVTEALAALGIPIRIGHSTDAIPEPTPPLNQLAVVYSSAVPESNPEREWARENGVACFQRGGFLAVLAESYRDSVAISGSHGKTTITAMTAHILREIGCNPGYLVGGSVRTWPFPAASGDGGIFVCEVDESDGTHTLIHPRIGIVPNVEDDHCWNFGGCDKLYENFRTFGRQCERLIYVRSETTDRLFGDHPNAIRYDFDSLAETVLPGGNPVLCGRHQIVNAALAVEAATILGVSRKHAIEVIGSFPGVKRRMTLHHRSNERALIEDYAHHPTEVRFALDAIRTMFPGRRLVVVFQPHRYARLERYLSEFAEELRVADAVIVVPVFAAWTPTSACGPEELVARIGDTAEFCAKPWPEMAEYVVGRCGNGAVLAVLGAGDVDALVAECAARM